jgi:predicted NBD/HSP70 family sugar kinase
MEQAPLRSTDIRDRNQKLVLQLLFEKGAMSQSQVVLETGLKAPTVFRIFAKLAEDNYITPCDCPGGPSPETGERKGRRPAYYCAVPTAAYAVGVDFSTAGVSVIVVDFLNRVIHHQSRDFTPGIHRDEVLSRIGQLIGASLDHCHVKRDRLIGIGIGAPGVVNTETGVVEEYARIDGLASYSIKGHFEKLFGVPVFVHNNASVIAASEYYYDAAVDYESVLAVLVRGGVGGAFVNHGTLFVNGSTTALELGRTSVCFPGGEAIASDPQTLESLAGEEPLLEAIRAAEGVAAWCDVEERVPEERLADLIRQPAGVLATAVRNLYHILHPEAVLVISRYAKLARVLAAEIGRAVPEATAIPVPYDPVKACHGATDLVFRRFFADLEWTALPRERSLAGTGKGE